MKALLKFLAIMLLFTAFMACNDDDDTPIVIDDIMVVYNSDTGMFSSIDLTDGSLNPLGNVTYNGEVLSGLRDIVFNPNNDLIYASSRASQNNGAIFSIDPFTLEATLLNDNADEDWYAIPGIEIDNNRIIGTVYFDEYEEHQWNEGLIWLNLDGTMSNTAPLLWEANDLSLYEGMAIEYTSDGNEILVTRYDEVIVSDLSGNVMEIIELESVNFPEDESIDGIRTIETSEDGVIYGIDRDNHFGRIDLTVGSDEGTFTYIATLSPEDDRYVALSMIPENIFE